MTYNISRARGMSTGFLLRISPQQGRVPLPRLKGRQYAFQN